MVLVAQQMRARCLARLVLSTAMNSQTAHVLNVSAVSRLAGRGLGRILGQRQSFSRHPTTIRHGLGSGVDKLTAGKPQITTTRLVLCCSSDLFLLHLPHFNVPSSLTPHHDANSASQQPTHLSSFASRGRSGGRDNDRILLFPVQLARMARWRPAWAFME